MFLNQLEEVQFRDFGPLKKEFMIFQGNISTIYKLSAGEIIQIFELNNLDHFNRERLLRAKVVEVEIGNAENLILLGSEYTIEKTSLSRFSRRIKISDPKPLLRYLKQELSIEERLELAKQLVHKLIFYR